jgi:hypothetical protein
MKLFAFLFRRAPTLESDVPPILTDGIEQYPSSPSTLDNTDEIERAQTPTEVARAHIRVVDSEFIDLENIFCMIEYIDSNRDETRRRVTMNSLHAGPSGLILHAICHERKAIRHFRVDRIQSVITYDGEVFGTKAFFTDLLGIDISDISYDEDRAILAIARDLREHLRAPLSILVCAAMADRDLHIEEIDRIQSYAESEIYALHREGKISAAPPVEVMQKLCQMIASMRPQRRSMRGYVEKVSEWPEGRVARLNKALAKVITADGKVVSQELLFLEEMNAFAKASREERFGMIAAAEEPGFFEARF